MILYRYSKVFVMFCLWLSYVPCLLQTNELLSHVASSELEKEDYSHVIEDKHDEIVVAFDLHDVVFRLDKTRAVRYVLNTPGKLYLCSLVLSPRFWRELVDTRAIKYINTFISTFETVSQELY